MTDDIVERLRAVVKRAWDWDYCYPGNINIESLIIDLRKDAGEAAAEIERLRDENAQLAAAREALAHTDMGSLPNDWTLQQIAEARIDDMLKLRDQVRVTCRRAETAERQLAAAREALAKIAGMNELGVTNYDRGRQQWNFQAIARAALEEK